MERQRIAFVEDRKIAIVAERVTSWRRIRAHAEWNVLTHGQRARVAEQRRDPLAHLVRGLVGERNRQHLARRRLALGQDVGDTISDHAGLAGAGAGENQNRAVGGEYRGALLRIQIVEIHR